MEQSHSSASGGGEQEEEEGEMFQKEMQKWVFDLVCSKALHVWHLISSS